MNEIQKKIYSKMTCEEKIAISFGLYSAAREFKAAYFRDKYPDLTEVEIKEKVKKVFLHAHT